MSFHLKNLFLSRIGLLSQKSIRHKSNAVSSPDARTFANEDSTNTARSDKKPQKPQKRRSRNGRNDRKSLGKFKDVNHNMKLDLFKIRKDLENFNILSLSSITKVAETNMNDRYIKADINFNNDLKNIKDESFVENINDNTLQVSTYMYTNLGAGDIIQLNKSNTLSDELCLILSTPMNVNDQSFIVISQRGNIFRINKASISFRIPRALPEEYIQKYVMKQILMHSTQEELIKTAGITEVADPLLVDENGLTIIDGKRYEISSAARTFIIKYISQILKKAWNLLPSTMIKLNNINNALKRNGITSVSFFQLVILVNRFSLKKIEDVNLSEDVEDIVAKYSELRLSKDQFSMGINFEGAFYKDHPSSFRKVSYELFFSVFLALQKQSELWMFTDDIVSTNIRSPMTVRVKSISTINDLRLLYDLNRDRFKNGQYNKFENLDTITKPITNYINKKIDANSMERLTENMEKNSLNSDSKPEYFDDFICMLKLFVSGHVNYSTSDSEILSLISYIMKNINILKEREDFNKSCGLFLLEKLGELPEIEYNNDPTFDANMILKNPNMWNLALGSPYLNILGGENINQIEDDYYNSLSVEQLKQTEDPLEGFRNIFDEKIPVFCIDSADAHEIDDGVAIEKISETIDRIYIHIADPASYIKPDSLVLKIALKRSETMYFNEYVKPMLPKVVSDVAGLANPNQKELTRTMTFSCDFDHLKKTITNQKISASLVKNFVAITYEEVDQLLSPTNANKLPYIDDLKKLLQVAQSYRKIRISRGAVNFNFSKYSVVQDSSNENVKDTQNKIDQLKIIKTDEYIYSTTLVSELMILANSLVGDFFSRNKIPLIFRNLSHLTGYFESKNFAKNDHESIYKSFLNMIRNHDGDSDIPYESVIKFLNLFNQSYYSNLRAKHSFLGVDTYSPTTSPLRRYGDLIGHWNLHEYLRGGNNYPFSFRVLFNIAGHMQTRKQITKHYQRFSDNFWKIQIIIRDLNENADKDVYNNLTSICYNGNNNKYKATVLPSVIRDTFVNCELQEFGLRVKLKINSDDEIPNVGDTLDVKIYLINPVECSIFVHKFPIGNSLTNPANNNLKKKMIFINEAV